MLGNVIAAGAAFLTSTAHALPFIVSLESEASGIQSTTSRYAGGVETFDARPIGSGRSFTTDFGGSVFRGEYSGVQISPADQYGGAGGTGRYAVTFTTAGFTLDLSSAVARRRHLLRLLPVRARRRQPADVPVGGRTLFTFSAREARDFINGLPGREQYLGNPNTAFAGRNRAEPYAFLNVYARRGTTFDRVVFQQAPQGGGYESDNHSVGRWQRISGTVIPTPASARCPNPPPGR